MMTASLFTNKTDTMESEKFTVFEILDLLNDERERLHKKRKWYQFKHPKDKGLSHATKIILKKAFSLNKRGILLK